MPSRKALENPNRPKPAPVEYAGQWVAWNRERTEIIAHGRSLEEVSDLARAAGHEDPILQCVPQPYIRVFSPRLKTIARLPRQ